MLKNIPFNFEIYIRVCETYHLVVFVAYSQLCGAQASFLVVLRRPYVMLESDPGSIKCNISALILQLQLSSH